MSVFIIFLFAIAVVVIPVLWEFWYLNHRVKMVEKRLTESEQTMKALCLLAVPPSKSDESTTVIPDCDDTEIPDVHYNDW